jgi:hypothetical protein
MKEVYCAEGDFNDTFGRQMRFFADVIGDDGPMTIKCSGDRGQRDGTQEAPIAHLLV